MQLIIDKDEGVKAFESYMKVAFPSLAQRKKKKDDEAKKLMQAWVGLGPLKVTPMPEVGPARSKMKQRATRVQNDLMERVYSKTRR